MAKNRDSTKTDFSSFMCIILMLTGCLITILISNVVVIAANPNNVEITSIVNADLNNEEVEVVGGNIIKNPWYVEVERDQITIYPGEHRMSLKDLENKQNAFEELIERVKAKSESQYIVLLVRPYASSVARQLKKIIVDRKVDVGIDLLDRGMPLVFSGPGGKATEHPARSAASDSGTESP